MDTQVNQMPDQTKGCSTILRIAAKNYWYFPIWPAYSTELKMTFWVVQNICDPYVRSNENELMFVRLPYHTHTHTHTNRSFFLCILVIAASTFVVPLLFPFFFVQFLALLDLVTEIRSPQSNHLNVKHCVCVVVVFSLFFFQNSISLDHFCRRFFRVYCRLCLWHTQREHCNCSYIVYLQA